VGLSGIGAIGLIADSGVTAPVTVAFDDIVVERL
jgi:hypothetical protein